MNTPQAMRQPPEGDRVDTSFADEATLARRFVRITERRPNGFVAFEFSVGWPDMSVELALPEQQFNEFCSKFLTEAVGDKLGDNHDEH